MLTVSTGRGGPLRSLLGDPDLTFVASGWDSADADLLRRFFADWPPVMRLVDVQVIASQIHYNASTTKLHCFVSSFGLSIL